MSESAPSPTSVVQYAAALAFGGVAAAVVVSWVLPTGPADARLWLGLASLAVASIWVPLRFRHAGGVQGFNLEEAVLIAALLALPVGWAPLLLAGSAALGYGLRVREPVKVLFNVGQTALWASVGTVVFTLFVGDPSASVLTARSVLAVVAAVVALNLVSLLAMAELFRRLEGRTYTSVIRDVLPISVATGLGNTSAGLLLAVVVRAEPLGVLLAAPLIVGTYLGYRAYARGVEEQRRAERLRAISTDLAGALGEPDALTRFLEQVVDLFGGANAEFLLLEGAGDEGVLHRSDGTRRRAAPEGLILKTVGDPRSSFAPVGRSYGDAIVAPVVYRGRTVGALAVYGRHGLELWGDADASLLGALAGEAAVALKNVELFAEIEQERARLEAESTKLGDILAAASDGIAMLGADGTIRAWNPAMESITGVDERQAVGQPWFVVLRLRDDTDEDLLPETDHALARAIAGERRPDPLDLQALRRDGQWRWIRATFAPILREDAGLAGTVMVARDATAEREVEELKADFVATVSHELRTPLTPLKGFLSTFQRGLDRMTIEQIAGVHEAMGTQVTRLEDLVADLLVVADLDRGALRLTPEAVDLLDAVRSAIEEEEARGSTTRLALLRPDTPVIANADGSAVVRICRALISNALKHTDGRVEIEVRRDGERAQVRVRDEGPGIPQWEQARIFHRFHRLGAQLTRAQGPGLGLPIARALADRLGGTVTVESEVGDGSVFTLTLPLSRPRTLADEDTRRAS